MQNIFKSIFCSFCLLCWAEVFPTEYQPWLGNYLEFEWRNSLMYQGYTSISSGSHLEKDSGDDLFLDVSLSNSTPDIASIPPIGIELELRAASTRKQRGDIDQFKATFRYVWEDDTACDPLSIASGVSLIQAFRHSVKDISSFHHGQAECELFISVGKEISKDCFWDSRLWAVAGLGVADRGSPWLRFNIAHEKRWCEFHEIKTFVNTLWGFGRSNLHRYHFDGYGPVRHQSIDVGLRYTYELDFFGSASLEYTYRAYARNFPVHTSCVIAQLLYTFGL